MQVMIRRSSSSVSLVGRTSREAVIYVTEHSRVRLLKCMRSAVKMHTHTHPHNNHQWMPATTLGKIRNATTYLTWEVGSLKGSKAMKHAPDEKTVFLYRKVPRNHMSTVSWLAFCPCNLLLGSAVAAQALNRQRIHQGSLSHQTIPPFFLLFCVWLRSWLSPYHE